MKPYLVDVPVRVMVWARPDYLKKQFEVIRQARPSVLFLVSDGGRTPEEMAKILESRKVVENIDWECKVHKLYMEENQGMYAMMKKMREYIWDRTDRCIFLEDDYVPAVSYFRYCAELLEKYRYDERVQMICGYNPLGVYDLADQEQDYFFTENGWAIWGCAYWKRSTDHTEFPLPYSESPYIHQCLKDNLTHFWQPKAEGYMRGELVENHVPGDEYFFCANSALHHRLSIVPSRNLISNIGIDGAHAEAKTMLPEIRKLFHTKVYELEFPLRHPQYMIDDKNYSRLYEDALLHSKVGFFTKLSRWLRVRWLRLRHGTLAQERRNRNVIEK